MLRRRQKPTPPQEEAFEFREFDPSEWLTIGQALEACKRKIKTAPDEMGLSALAKGLDKRELPNLFAQALTEGTLPRIVPIASFPDKDRVLLFEGTTPPRIIRVVLGHADDGLTSSVGLRINTDQLQAVINEGQATFAADVMDIPRNTRDVAAPQSEHYERLQQLMSYMPEAMRPNLRPGRPE